MSARVVAMLTAGAGVILGVPTLLAVSTPDLRISTALHQSGDQRTVVLRTGAAEMLCTVRLHLTVVLPQPEPRFQATLSGRPLIAQPERGTKTNTWTVKLLPTPSPVATQVSADGPATGTHAAVNASDIDHFPWPPSGEILVSVPGATTLSIDRWEVFDKKAGVDSSDLAFRRRWTFWLTAGLVALTLIGAVSGASSSKAAAPITAAGIVHSLINSMQGNGHERSRQILTRVLIDRTGIEEALEATGLPKMQQHQELLRTIRRFKDRLHNLKQDLAQYCHILDGASPPTITVPTATTTTTTTAAKVPAAADSAPQTEDLLAHVDDRYREQVRQFLETGEATKDCLAYIEGNPYCQLAIKQTFGTHAAAFERLAKKMTTEPAPPTPPTHQ